jgi:hypothetical protein
MSETSDVKPTIFEKNRRRRDIRVAPLGDVRLSPDIKALVCELVADGALLGELCDRGILPAYHYLWREMQRDAEFSARYKQAQADGARVLLHAAEENAIDAVNSNDPDRARAADALMRITETFAEKIAPKEFGQLVKLGSDPDAPLTLQVVSYAAVQLATDKQQAIDADYTETPAIAGPQEASRAHEEAD